MLEQALLCDGAGRPITQDGPGASRDWDEVQDFCRRVYMPYRVRPLGRGLRPDATLRSASVGRVTLTRFSYGVPIHLDAFDPAAGNVLVLNTLQGSLRHQGHGGADPVTRAGDSFVVDCSRTDYWLEGDGAHMQLNLTIPHAVLAETALRWFGAEPGDRLWTRRQAFGGPRWQALLGYVAQTIGPDGRVVGGTPMETHLEELLCVELLRLWAAGAGESLADAGRAAAPRHVREAEEIMQAEARSAPAIGEIARRVGVSARTLSEGFQRFRGCAPRDALRERRLDGVRAALRRAAPGDTVTSVALDWGYANFGAMAQAYAARFGEKPSQTLAQARQAGDGFRFRTGGSENE